MQHKATFLIAAAIVASGAGLALFGPGAMAQSGESANVLAGIERGEWQLRLRETGTVQRICVRTGQELIQLRHPQSGCSRYVVETEPSSIVVQYACPGDGYGRTSIRRESSRVVHISSLGIAGKRPFDIDGEARYAGPCRR